MSRTVQDLRSTLIDSLSSSPLTSAPWTVVDFPSHFNSGDSAIWLGERALARDLGTKITAFVDRSDRHRTMAANDSLVVLHGGGNLGGLYPSHEVLRIEALRTYKNRPIVQLPQSIEYGSETDREELLRAVSACRDLLVLVRDRRSLAIAERDFDCAVAMVPDAAFALGPLQRSPARTPVVVQRRTDREADVSGEGLAMPAFDWLEARPTEARRFALAALRLQLRLTKIPTGGFGARARLANAHLLARLNMDRAVQLISAGEKLITDRLHGHVLACLLGVPHIVVNDRYGKIEALWSTWTHDLGIAQFAPNWDTALAAAPVR